MCYLVLFVHYMLLTTFPVLYSMCAGVRVVLFCTLFWSNEVCVCMCVCVCVSVCVCVCVW